MVLAMLVVLAAFWCCGQAAGQISRHQLLDGLIGSTGYNVNALLAEHGKGALANAPGDNNSHPQTLQPAGKHPWLVLWSGQRFGAQGGLAIGIHLNDLKLAAAAEMRVKAALLNGNGNLHNSVFCIRLLHCIAQRSCCGGCSPAGRPAATEI